MLSDEYQRLAMDAICCAAQGVASDWQQVTAEHSRPCVLFRPSLSIDGNKWCALYGENLQDGVAGFGDSPAAAMHDFDREWHRALTQTESAHG